MTDRHAGYVVTLENELRDDDAQSAIRAIRMIKGVLSVQPVLGGIEQSIANERARHQLGSALWNVLYPKSVRSDG